MRNSLNREVADLDTRNHVDSGLTDLVNASPAPETSGAIFDWSPIDADLQAWRARVAQWEMRFYAAIVTSAIAGIGITALVGALTTTTAGLPS